MWDMEEEPPAVISKTAAISRPGFCPPKIAGWLVLCVVFKSEKKMRNFHMKRRGTESHTATGVFWREVVERNPAMSMKNAGLSETSQKKSPHFGLHQFCHHSQNRACILEGI